MFVLLKKTSKHCQWGRVRRPNNWRNDCVSEALATSAI